MLTVVLLTLGLLGLAGVLIGNYARQEGWGASAAANILCGLGLIGLVSFVAFSPGLDTREDLSAELAAANQTIDRNKLQIAELESDNISLNEQLAAALKLKRVFLEQQETRYRALFDSAVKANPEQERVYRDDEGTRPASEQSIAVDHKRLDDQLTHLARVIARLRSSRSRPSQSVSELFQLKNRLGLGLETDNYSIVPYPDNEVVRGRKGRYYVVDMKNAATGVRFRFEAGKYTLDRSAREFREALSSFARDIATKLDGNVDYSLYVRGSADAAPYVGRHEAGFEYAQVKYMPALGGGRYVKQLRVRDIGRRVKNKDLPFLRAEFLRNIVRDVYPVEPPSVLEGSVTRKVDNADRNVELILFADW